MKHSDARYPDEIKAERQEQMDSDMPLGAATCSPASPLMVRIYNQGYHAGHEDTVEACFTPIHHTEMDTYHADVVAEILQENTKSSDPTDSLR